MKDVVQGDSGDDLIFGDAGANILTGGPGRDIFFCRRLPLQTLFLVLI
jgi:Ca2+-binding RTX toxin-like protein